MSNSISAEANSMKMGLNFKWAIAFVLPFVIYFTFLIFEPNEHKMAMFFAITSWAVGMWAFSLMPDAIVALLLPVLYMNLCGTPSNVVFSSWLGETPYIIITGFILSKTMQETGLGKRIGLFCINAARGSFAGTLWGILIASFLITPVVPTLLGKSIMFCTILVAVCEVLKLEKGSNASTALMLSAFFALSASGNAVITGNIALPLVVERVSQVTGETISWLGFAQINFIPSLLFGIVSILLLQFCLPAKINKEELKSAISKQYEELGKITKDEKILLFIMVGILTMLALSGAIGLKTSTILMVAVFAFFLPFIGIMNGKKLASINFTPLFFVMSCLSIGSAATQLNATAWIAENLLGGLKEMSVLGASLTGFFTAFVINFVMTPVSAMATFTPAVAQIALDLGINPYVLVGSFTAGYSSIILPYESATLLLFYSFGYIDFKKMVLLLGLRTIAYAIVLATLTLPYMLWATS